MFNLIARKHCAYTWIKSTDDLSCDDFITDVAKVVSDALAAMKAGASFILISVASVTDFPSRRSVFTFTGIPIVFSSVKGCTFHLIG